MPYLLDAIMDLKGRGLTGTRVIHTFIGRRVLPLKMRHHPKWEFRGPTDPRIRSRCWCLMTDNSSRGYLGRWLVGFGVCRTRR